MKFFSLMSDLRNRMKIRNLIVVKFLYLYLTLSYRDLNRVILALMCPLIKSSNFEQPGDVNPLNPELNPICYFLTLLAHHFLHVSRIRVKSLTLKLLMSYIYIYVYIYIYGAPILDVSRSHTTTQHSR